MKIFNLAFLLLFQFFSCNQALELPQTSHLPDSVQKQKRDKAVAATFVFKSTDGGQAWQYISEGLPEPKKEIFPEEYSYWGEIILKTYKKLYSNIPVSVFKTAGGTVLIISDRGLFKSTNSGKSWKPVHVGGSVMQLVESNGVLMATSMKGIIRSTDDGENWALVISDGVGIEVKPIEGGFAAITSNAQSRTRRVRTSYDGGKTWEPIDAGLPGQSSITSIIQVGENFICGHPAGIFRSSDKGKTWILLFPSIEGKAFYLSVSGNVIYAISSDGC